ncbi:hypothetical protein FOQG_19189 [Fusarium oxysporum f. sp. raphani 54005]|uniref:Uncharacterized protein n=1 Tax=Fusarium oxysporum f. sp. raphani 54005 TaxID=1089458 RepID=X0BZT5_FUSOX|nr:hypothetical protein FOQG_19189 [Fusarium oxysporum f. sp. raphani 54005]
MAAARPTRILLDVSDNVSPIKDEERPLCEEWLQSVGFLAPGKDQDMWVAIVQNWEQFLKATKTKITGSGASRRFVQGPAAKKREAIKGAFWEKMDGLEGLSERWPVKARRTINQAAEWPDARPFESLAAIWDLDKRRRYQSMWTSMICFLVWTIDNDRESLEDMGLELDEELEEDIVDISLAVAPGSDFFADDDDPKDAIQGFLTKLITDESVTARKNPLLWWTSILVRSAISGDETKDFISRGTISMNMLPPDVDIKGRIEAIGHYSKVLILDKAFMGWRTGRPDREVLAEEIAQDLNEVDNEWLNIEDGPRPDDRLDRRTCQSPAWKMMLKHLEQEGNQWLGGQKEKTTMWEIRRLLFSLRGVRE